MFLKKNGSRTRKRLFTTAVLGVDSGGRRAIKAYRKLSLKYHPDHNPGDEEAAEKFRNSPCEFSRIDKKFLYGRR